MAKRIIIAVICIFFTFQDYSSGKRSYHFTRTKSKRVITGLENFISKYARRYKGKIATVVTNQTGVDYYLRRNLNQIRNKGIEIALILAPEHGIYGYQNHYDKKMYNVDDRYNAIIYNLHKLNSKSLKHLLKLSQIVIFDIQDMGMRCYTYISSLKFIMDTLNGSEKEIIVLDRPNPLGFLGTDGAYLDDDFYSRHISAFPSPFIYNMTIGESALYYKKEFAKKVKLRVIQLKNYRRRMLFYNTQLPWVPPSPNLPTYRSSIIYSAIVLLEGINLSLGRGTTKPFEYIGAPWIEPVSFCNGLKRLGLKNFTFIPNYFEPTFSVYKGKRCGGVQIFYLGGKFSPTEVAFKIISYIKKRYSQFEWNEYKGSYTIDYLSGTDLLRDVIEDEENFNVFVKKTKGKVNKFRKKRSRYLFYRG